MSELTQKFKLYEEFNLTEKDIKEISDNFNNIKIKSKTMCELIQKLRKVCDDESLLYGVCLGKLIITNNELGEQGIFLCFLTWILP